MKQLAYYLSFMPILFISLVSCGDGEKTMLAEGVLLSQNWILQSSEKISQGGDILSTPSAVTSSWYLATVPSTVMGVLTSNGEYKDLFFGTNYKDADRSIFDVPWWYRTTFKTSALGEGKHVKLLLDGISYRANIWLNGQLIGSKDEIYGSFCRFDIDITKYLQEENVLAVEVFRAQGGEPNIGFVDWNPRPLDESMGLFREVKLKITGSVELNNTWVRSKVNKEALDEAWVTIETQVSNLTDKRIKGKIEGIIENIKFSIPVSLNAGEQKVITITPDDVKDLHIANPRLWWCNNLGTPELYDLNLQFVTGGQISAEDNIRFGIREIETYMVGDNHKGFMLNGQKVLVKSAGWTDDIFLRDSPESYETQVQYVNDMNLNSIRFESVWGTSQKVYDLCDQYGLMAIVGWTCQWEWENYFGAPAGEFGCISSEHDMNLLVRYLKDQLYWLRNHPSLIAWLGGSDELLDPELERRYMALWPNLTDVPYIGSAAARTSEVTGPSGMKMKGPYDYVGPNYWFIDTRAGGNYGFNTETGVGSQVPVYESLLKMIPENKLWPLSEYWDYHTTTAGDMDTMEPTIEAVNAMYGKPNNLNRFLNNAYLLNSQSTQSMFEAFRVNQKVEATGVVQWMLNSAWPSIHWQLYDYYKVPVAAYYGVKRGNNPLQLIYNYKDNGIYAVNDTRTSVGNLTAVVRGYSVGSILLFEEKRPISMTAGSVQNIFTIDNSARNTFLFLSIYDEQNNILAENFYCLSSKQDEYARRPIWYKTPITSHGDFKALAGLPRAELNIRVVSAEGDNAGVVVEIENPSKTIAFLAQFALTDSEKEIIAPVFWSDNYVSILPGERKILECLFDNNKINAKPTSLKVSGWNLAEKRINMN